jgi:hypothetical protein
MKIEPIASPAAPLAELGRPEKTVTKPTLQVSYHEKNGPTVGRSEALGAQVGRLRSMAEP